MKYIVRKIVSKKTLQTALLDAARNGSRETIHFVFETMKQKKIQIDKLDKNTIRNIGEKGNVNLLKSLSTQGVFEMCPILKNNLFQMAAKKGYIDLLEWIWNIHRPDEEIMYNAFFSAATCFRFDSMQFLLKCEPNLLSLTSDDKASFVYIATEDKNVELRVFLKERLGFTATDLATCCSRNADESSIEWILLSQGEE